MLRDGLAHFGCGGWNVEETHQNLWCGAAWQFLLWD